MINRFIANGRITKQPELRYTNNHVAVIGFTLAVTRNFKNNEENYDSDFINCVAFRNTAELINNYVKKGDLIGIEGSIQTRNYKDKDDKTIYVTEVIVEKIDFLQQKKEDKKEVETNAPQEMQQKDPFEEFGEEVELDDLELPF